MATLIQLQAQLAALQITRASGTLKVVDGPRSVEYRTMAELERAIAAIAAQIVGLNVASGMRLPARQIRTVTSKGT